MKFFHDMRHCNTPSTVNTLNTLKPILPAIHWSLLIGSVAGIVAVILGAMFIKDFETRQYVPMILFLAPPCATLAILAPAQILRRRDKDI